MKTKRNYLAVVALTLGVASAALLTNSALAAKPMGRQAPARHSTPHHAQQGKMKPQAGPRAATNKEIIDALNNGTQVRSSGPNAGRKSRLLQPHGPRRATNQEIIDALNNGTQLKRM